MLQRARVEAIAARFGACRVLAVGDVILDRFLWGNVSRISPEAPVPVVEVTRESAVPGGAANVARNLREFTPHVTVAGRIGEDAAGGELASLLEGQGVHVGALLRDGAIPTATKTRIVARHQQVVRFDRERRAPLGAALEERFLAYLAAHRGAFDAVVVADYNKGFVTAAVAEALSEFARRDGTGAQAVLAVDPHPGNPIRWRRAAVVKPNYGEAFSFAGRPLIPFEDDPAALGEVGERLLGMWDTQNALVTLGEHGMMLFRPGREPFHVAARAREVFDVSGAGDTAIAVLALSLASGATPEEATEIANHASGIVVGKLGTATLTPAELLESFS